MDSITNQSRSAEEHADSCIACYEMRQVEIISQVACELPIELGGLDAQAANAEPVSVARPTEIVPDARPSILVVDDDREMCDLLDADLTRRGYRVSCFTSPNQALAALDSSDFAVLLVD